MPVNEKQNESSVFGFFKKISNALSLVFLRVLLGKQEFHNALVFEEQEKQNNARKDLVEEVTSKMKPEVEIVEVEEKEVKQEEIEQKQNAEIKESAGSLNTKEIDNLNETAKGLRVLLNEKNPIEAVQRHDTVMLTIGNDVIRIDANGNCIDDNMTDQAQSIISMLYSPNTDFIAEKVQENLTPYLKEDLDSQPCAFQVLNHDISFEQNENKLQVTIDGEIQNYSFDKIDVKKITKDVIERVTAKENERVSRATDILAKRQEIAELPSVKAVFNGDIQIMNNGLGYTIQHEGQEYDIDVYGNSKEEIPEPMIYVKNMIDAETFAYRKDFFEQQVKETIANINDSQHRNDISSKLLNHEINFQDNLVTLHSPALNCMEVYALAGVNETDLCHAILKDLEKNEIEKGTRGQEELDDLASIKEPIDQRIERCSTEEPIDIQIDQLKNAMLENGMKETEMDELEF